jgi:clan AA aspartic protease (TIGR02281 family)
LNTKVLGLAVAVISSISRTAGAYPQSIAAWSSPILVNEYIDPEERSHYCVFRVDSSSGPASSLLIYETSNGSIGAELTTSETWGSTVQVYFRIYRDEHPYGITMSPSRSDQRVLHGAISDEFLRQLSGTGGMDGLTVSAPPLLTSFATSGISRAISVLHMCALHSPWVQVNSPWVRVDPASGTSSIPSSQVPKQGQSEVQLIRHHFGTFGLLATINGTTRLTFTLDTGASDVTLPRSVATKLMVEGSLTEDDYIGIDTYRLANGNKERSPKYMLHSITVGNRTVTNVECSIGDDDHSLLLGQSFLNKFRSWSVDNQRGVLVLE